MHVAQENGFRPTLHALPVGVRGFIPHHTIKALKDLGVRAQALRTLEIKIGRITKESAVGIIWARRRAEKQLPEAIKVSGAARMEHMHKRKKALKRQYPDTGRPPG